MDRVLSISPDGLVFSTVSSCILFISPNGLVFSTVSSCILSISSGDLVKKQNVHKNRR
ncbi:hypothetical protein [Gardnerella sp. 2492-Sm]|uniref:hypothetical protein n=1 Tax=unclassified Gardnerella TaxID=2628112 RepID=UPI003D087DA0